MNYATNKKLQRIVRNAIKNAIKAEPPTTEEISKIRNGAWRSFFLDEISPVWHGGKDFWNSEVVKALRETDKDFEKIIQSYYDAQHVYNEATSKIDEFLADVTGETMF